MGAPNDDSLLRRLFIGNWHIIANEISKEEESLEGPTIEADISTTTLGELECKIKRKRKLAEPKTITCTQAHIDAQNETFCCKEGNKQLCISFWRHFTYDMLFALIENNNGDPIEIWSAQRTGTPRPLPNVLSSERPFNTRWKIELETGTHAAKNSIEIVPLEVVKAENPPLPLGLFGLFHYQDEATEGELYDVLAYNCDVRSYNSIFNVRSFNYSQADDESKDRVFATFNNKFSLPSTHLPSTYTGSAVVSLSGVNLPGYDSSRLGQLMPFEARAIKFKKLRRAISRLHDANLTIDELSDVFSKLIKAIHDGNYYSLSDETIDLLLGLFEGSDSDSNDPDIGVWVGVPA